MAGYASFPDWNKAEKLVKFMTLKFKYKAEHPSLTALSHYLHIPGCGVQLWKTDNFNIFFSVIMISNSLLQPEKERCQLKKRNKKKEKAKHRDRGKEKEIAFKIFSYL